MTFSNCKRKQQSCQSQLYNMYNINTLCRLNNNKMSRRKTLVMTSKSSSWCYKHATTSKSSSWRQKYFMTSKSLSYDVKKSSSWHNKSCHDIKNTSWSQKVRHDVKSTLWCQKVRHGVNNMSWRQQVRHDVKKRHDVKMFGMTSKSSSWRQTIRHNGKKCVMASKSYRTMLCHLKVIADGTQAHSQTDSLNTIVPQPLCGSTNNWTFVMSVEFYYIPHIHQHQCT